MRVIGKKSIDTIISMLMMLLCVSPAYAARSNGELIFAGDLAVGEIVNVQIATSTDMDAMVVAAGETPRLILLEDLGSACRYAPPGTQHVNLAYDLSELKPVIDSRTAGHGSYLFNITAPFAQEVVSTYYHYDGLIDAGINKVEDTYFWTRSTMGSNKMCRAGNGFCFYASSESTHGVRPAFNLKSDTILKYNTATAKYTVADTAADRAAAYFKKNGFDGIVHVPQGQTPAGFTALPDNTGVFYQEFNGQFLFVYAMEYTVPTNIGDLNIN